MRVAECWQWRMTFLQFQTRQHITVFNTFDVVLNYYTFCHLTSQVTKFTSFSNTTELTHNHKTLSSLMTLQYDWLLQSKLPACTNRSIIEVMILLRFFPVKWYPLITAHEKKNNYAVPLLVDLFGFCHTPKFASYCKFPFAATQNSERGTDCATAIVDTRNVLSSIFDIVQNDRYLPAWSILPPSSAH